MKIQKSLIVASLLAIIMTGCAKEPDNRSPEQKVQANASAKYNMTGEEVSRANNNAKQYFEKSWPIADNQHGMLNNCRPSDSNFNGKASCTGYVPNPLGAPKPYHDETVYCGYNTTIIGCSDKDD